MCTPYSVQVAGIAAALLINSLTTIKQTTKGQGSIRGVFGLMSKINFTLSNYRFVIWDKNYRRYFVI